MDTLKKNNELTELELSDIYNEIKQKINDDGVPLLNDIQTINNFDNTLYNFLKKNIKKGIY